MKKMFCAFLALFLTSSIVLADNDVELAGFITDVNFNAKTITVKTPYDATMQVQVMPNTEVDLDDCGLFGLYDGFGSFKDLKPGVFVELELFNAASLSTGKGIAKEIKISCKNKAY